MQDLSRTSKKYTAAVINLGCKVNKYESDSMKNKLSEAGLLIVDSSDVADFYIVNTCSVTNMAERKSRQMLRRVKRRNPEAVVVAAGCYVNAAGDELVREDFVDVVVGNNCKKDIVDILKEYMNDSAVSGNTYTDDMCNEQAKSYVDIGNIKEYEEMGVLSSAYMDHRRAYIKISDGCNQFCSYCIIPYTRGRVRSRRPDNILREISALADSGVKEFVLTGIHISSYGTDFENSAEGIRDLGDLVAEIAKIDKVMRIRLSSLEPRIITEGFLKKICDIPKLCPHFHLSLQSACNDTLKRMNRRYTIEEYEEKCELLRKYFDRPALTTDVIVGFPGEDEREFAVSVDNLKRLELYEIHVFKYSVRRGTRAEKMSGQVPEEEKNRRSDILLELTGKQKEEYESSLQGLEDELLVEEKVDDRNTADVDVAANRYKGHTKRYVMVEIDSESDIVNEIIPYTYCKF